MTSALAYPMLEYIPYEDKAETWFDKDREFVKQNGLVCMSSHYSCVPSTQLAQS
jgi:hypothetical protein